MNDFKQLSQFVGNMYDCIAEPTRWQKELGVFCFYYGSDVAWLGVSDPKRQQTRLAAIAGAPEKSAAMKPNVNKNPFFKILHKLEIDEPTGLHRLCQLMGPEGVEIFEKSDFTRDYAIPHRLGDGVAISLVNEPHRVGTFGMVSSLDRPPFAPGEYESLAILAPHMRRAITIGDLFETQKRESTMFREVVEGLGFAVFVVDCEMQMKFANPAAEDLLREATFVRAAANDLRFDNSVAHDAINRAIITGQRNEVALGGAGIGVPLTRHLRPAVAHVMPLSRRTEAAQFHEKAIAAIFVASAGDHPLPAMEAIAAIFGLTAAEKRVAALVANGKSAKEIAATNGVAYSTARAQLDSIYAKTGISHYRDLVILLRDLTPPTRTD
jgi:DNA-binding CsgD family transcriptional regulator/PAS domain-containing protein